MISKKTKSEEEKVLKRKICVLTAALALTASLALAGCGDNNADPVHREGTQAGTYRGIESTESVYGIAAVTAAKLLAGAESAESVSAAEVQTTAAVASGSADAIAKAQAEAEDFNRYFNMLDTFLDRGATTTVVEENASQDEALKDYAFKLTITGKDAEGKSVPHTDYYSETATPSTHSSRVQGDETITVDVTTYTLNGLVEMGRTAEGTPVYYVMTGTRTETEQVETEGREQETEHTSALTMRASATAGDPADYVVLSHTQTTEQEEGESETEASYLYHLYRGGVLAESTQVDFETEAEHGETETEYTVRFLSGASRGTYKIERETERGATEIAVAYSIDGASGTFVIVKDAGGYRYRFSDRSADDELFPDFDD